MIKRINRKPAAGGVMDAHRAFYIPPSCVIKTSAEIIKEARTEMSARLVDTKRPFTPRVKDRRLFGAGHKASLTRPPSSFSIRQVEFQDDASIKLPPIQSPPVHAKSLKTQHATSLTNLPEEVEAESQAQDIIFQSTLRQTHSSPQERIRPDGLEPLPKVKYYGSSNARFSDSYRSLLVTKRNSFSQKRNSSGQPRLSKPKTGLCKSHTPEAVITENDEEILTPNVDILRLDSSLKSSKKTSLIKPAPLITQSIPLISKESERSIQDNIVNEQKTIEAESNTKLKIQQLLSELEDLYEEGKNENKLVSVLDELYKELKNDNSSKKSNKLNAQIIKILYKFVEAGSDILLLYSARVILALRLSGQNLTAVNKLIFKVSRSDKNDSLFLNANILELFVETLGCASPLEDAEACIYGYGALKFLTMNNQIIQVVLKLGIIELMSLHMKIVNNARLELLPIPEQTSHAMFQLTSTIRNMASEDSSLKKFIKSGLINQLCISMELFNSDLDMVSNIARTFSIISTSEKCCDAIVHLDRSLQSIIKIFSKYPGRQDIVVRLGYALGNIIAKNETSRLKLFNEPSAMSAILSLLGSYLDKDLEMMKSSSSVNDPFNRFESPEWGSDGSVEDVIVKMIRIVANMSMDAEVGVSMTCLPVEDFTDNIYQIDQHNTRDGGKFLDILLMILRRKSVMESEELVMSALTTLNNMSFYAEPTISTDGPFAQRQIEIAQVLSTLLLTNNEESMVEVTRVLGNLTRSKEVRDYILEIGGVSQLVRCLDYSNKELLYTTTGVLVNLMADWDKRLAFKENNGVQKLISVLVRDGEKDWRLASLICQALWNFCIDSTHLYAALGVQSTNHLLSVLVDLIDEESLFGIKEGAAVPESVSESLDYRNWEQFATVATNLLEKIEQYLESLQAFQDQ